MALLSFQKILENTSPSFYCFQRTLCCAAQYEERCMLYNSYCLLCFQTLHSTPDASLQTPSQLKERPFLPPHEQWPGSSCSRGLPCLQLSRFNSLFGLASSSCPSAAAPSHDRLTRKLSEATAHSSGHRDFKEGSVRWRRRFDGPQGATGARRVWLSGAERRGNCRYYIKPSHLSW